MMLELLIIAVVLAIIFGLFGFTRISAGFMGIARVLFFIILVLILIAIIGQLAGFIVIA